MMFLVVTIPLARLVDRLIARAAGASTERGGGPSAGTPGDVEPQPAGPPAAGMAGA